MNHFAVYLKLTEHCKSTVFQLKKKKRQAIRPCMVALQPRSNMHRRDMHLNNGCFSESWDCRWISFSFAHIPVISTIHTCLMKY